MEHSNYEKNSLGKKKKMEGGKKARVIMLYLSNGKMKLLVDFFYLYLYLKIS